MTMTVMDFFCRVWARLDCCLVAENRSFIFVRVVSMNSGRGIDNEQSDELPNITSTGKLGVRPNIKENGAN